MAQVFQEKFDAVNSDPAGSLLIADGECPKIRALLATSLIPVVWLDGQQNPLVAVSEILANRRAQGSPVKILHIVSHGSPGMLKFSGENIEQDALLRHQHLVADWRLNDLALWSCFTGSDHAFVRIIEKLTGATVWTTDQSLGRLKEGGSFWRLTNVSKTKSKSHAPDLPICASQQLAWNHQLGSFITNTPIRPIEPRRTSHEYANEDAFAALKYDGSVIAWGSAGNGGDSSSVDQHLTSGVVSIFSNGASAFAALKTDGSVITWGDADDGGDSSAVDLTSGVKRIFSTYGAFAALKDDGAVITWGSEAYGSNSTSVVSSLSSGISTIYSNSRAFAALKGDGSVITWGGVDEYDLIDHGGDSSAVANSLTSGVSKIISTGSAFAALKTDGSVITWGVAEAGGNSSAVAGSLTSGVSQIFSTEAAFAALKTDGSVITWGDSDYGGNSSAVAGSLTSGVSTIFSNRYAFAALKNDGSVITWGDPVDGGDPVISYDDGREPFDISGSLTSGVSQIFATEDAFAALKTDGSVITWGDADDGGDSSVVAGSLTSGVSKIFFSRDAFAALKDDGSVITWGYKAGDSSAVANQLTSGVIQIVSTQDAMAALKDDGSVITWGDAAEGGDSSSVEDDLASGVVGFANPFTNDFYTTRSFSQVLPISVIDEEEPNEITGSDSDDILQGAGSLDVIKGGSGNDYLKAKDHNDILIGGSGNDSLYGGKDNDELIGGSGNDTLGGGKGDDILTGGSNADTFKISRGNDIIRDFSIVQNDRIDANGYSLEFTQDGSSLLISDADNDVLTTVLNLSRDDLFASQPELVV
uniref:DUF4347 domain-containing protein n=1 Tax=Synechococcus sp. UW106 TaxID=368495 RepID=UPI000E0E6A47|nr:DUF4347 domain-containing protein [Synechococcus sp. UW106]